MCHCNVKYASYFALMHWRHCLALFCQFCTLFRKSSAISTPLCRSSRALNLSQTEVHGAITFSPDFRHAAPGRHVLKVCRAEACQSMGCDSLIRHMEIASAGRL